MNRYLDKIDIFNAKPFGEFLPKLRMIRRAGFFIDQIGQELLARRLIVAMRVHGREVGRKRRDVVIILARIIRERVLAQFTPRPREIKRMPQ